jgi:hypothetical protein
MVRFKRMQVALDDTDQLELMHGNNAPSNAKSEKASVVSEVVMPSIIHPHSLIATSARLVSILGGGIALGASLGGTIGAVIGGVLGFVFFWLSEVKKA